MAAEPVSMEDLAVLIPVFDDLEGLEETLASIREPDNSFTVVVVDDGSPAPIELDHGAYPFEVVVLRNERNGGIVSALNTGLSFIRDSGRFSVLARLDAADRNREGRLTLQYQALGQDGGLAMVGSNACFRSAETGEQLFETRLPERYREVRKWMVFRNCFIHPTVMIHLGRVPEGLRYSSRFPHMEDYVLFEQLVCDRRCENLQQPLVDCFVREQGISRKHDRAQLVSGLRHHLGRPRPLNFLWYAYLAKRAIYLVLPYRARLRLKTWLRFVRPPARPAAGGALGHALVLRSGAEAER